MTVGMSLVFNAASRLEAIASVYAGPNDLKSVKSSSKISSKFPALGNRRLRGLPKSVSETRSHREQAFGSLPNDWLAFGW